MFLFQWVEPMRSQKFRDYVHSWKEHFPWFKIMVGKGTWDNFFFKKKRKEEREKRKKEKKRDG